MEVFKCQLRHVRLITVDFKICAAVELFFIVFFPPHFVLLCLLVMTLPEISSQHLNKNVLKHKVFISRPLVNVQQKLFNKTIL